MCGITGFFSPLPGGQGLSRQSLLDMTQSLQHRGPDAQGIMYHNTWGLGHRRLKVIDLSDVANQPMQDREGTVNLVFNGEIYNYRSLRQQLIALGHTFRTTSDTEVVMLAFQQWGKDCFAKFNGMFALAIFDATTDELILAVDRLGKKPLFYAINNGCLIFASEIKSFLTLPDFKPEISLEAIHSYLLCNYIPEPQTIFSQVRKARAHHIITFSKQGLANASYWEIPAKEAIGSLDANSYHGHKETLDALINDAVAIRLNSDVPLGIFLSGGIDSSLIAAVATRHLPKLDTFCVVFGNDTARPEPTIARSVASHLGSNHTELLVNPLSFREIFPKLPKFMDEPFADDSLIPCYFLAQEARKHVVVALSGDGGDELFCGYPKYGWLAKVKPIFQAPYWLRRRVGQFVKTNCGGKIYKLGDFLENTRAEQDSLLWMSSTWKPYEIQMLLNGPGPFTNGNLPYTQGGFSDELLQELSVLDIKTFLKDDVLVKIDRASMFHSLEVRSPLLDYRLVEFALKLPLACKVTTGKSKIILKDLLSDYLPAHLIEKKKVGFNIPLRQWLLTDLRDYVDLYLSQATVESRGLFHWPYVDGIKKAFFAGKYDCSRKIYNLIILENWLQYYNLR